MHLEWKKWTNQIMRSFLPAGPSLVKQGLKPSSVLRHQTKFFAGKYFPLKHSTFSCYATHIDLANGARILSIRVCMQKLCYLEVDFPFFTPVVWDNATSASIIHGKLARHMFVI